ncbi:MAG: Uma2 family endonuclease [Pirellulales bacterium]|nr:Uma2 family endonuclease [Pirellulales bacterium]
MSTVILTESPLTTAPPADDDGVSPIVVRFAPLITLDDQAFMQFADQNPEYRFEQNSAGELVIMAPTGMQSGSSNFGIIGQLFLWSQKHRFGKCFESSTMFNLPNGARRSPDASWITQEKWDQLSKKQRQLFGPFCPDFVVELRSRTDRLRDLQAKMQEYLANGAQLGWLIDPLNKTVHVYRPGLPVEILTNPLMVSGDPLLPGFALELNEIWEPT